MKVEEVVVSPCPLPKSNSYSTTNTFIERKTKPVSSPTTFIKQDITKEWLERLIDEKNLRFHYFITLSFYKARRTPLQQYKENHHIKKVILDFFYPNGKKPKDRIRLWFFVERHQSGFLHLHILMEGINELTWLRKNNRDITLSKRTLDKIVSRDFSMDDVISETLTKHLKRYVRRLGKGNQSTDFRYVGDIQHRVQYCQKSLGKLDFDGWEHIDFENSDLDVTH